MCYNVKDKFTEILGACQKILKGMAGGPIKKGVVTWEEKILLY